MNPPATLSALLPDEVAWLRLSAPPGGAPAMVVVPVKEDPRAARFRAAAQRARRPGERSLNARIRRTPSGGYLITTTAEVDAAIALWRGWFAAARPAALVGHPIAFTRVADGRFTPPRTIRLQDHSQAARRIRTLCERARSGVFWFGEASGSLLLHIDKTPRQLKERRPEGATTLISGRIEGHTGGARLAPRAAVSDATARRMQRWIDQNAPQWPALSLLSVSAKSAA